MKGFTDVHEGTAAKAGQPLPGLPPFRAAEQQ